MTRLEPLTVAALGRSPYDDELIFPENHHPGILAIGQQYDDRGRPCNPGAQRQQKDLVHASNEVLQAAGIIESIDVINSRDDEKARKSKDQEMDIVMAYRRRALGQVALTAGVWGACGMRRRIELYKDYSNHPLLYIIGREKASSSWLKILGAGLPSLMMNRAIGNLVYYVNDEDYSKTTKTIFSWGASYIMFHYKYYAILQQLNFLPSSKWLPSIRFMIPFASESPFYLPSCPITLSYSSALSFLGSAALVVAPIALLHAWYHISNHLIALIYAPLYHVFPHASNLNNINTAIEESATRAAALKAQIAELEAQAQALRPGVVEEWEESDTESSNNSTTTWDANEDVLRNARTAAGHRHSISGGLELSDAMALRAFEGGTRRRSIDNVTMPDLGTSIVDPPHSTSTRSLSPDHNLERSEPRRSDSPFFEPPPENDNGNRPSSPLLGLGLAGPTRHRADSLASTISVPEDMERTVITFDVSPNAEAVFTTGSHLGNSHRHSAELRPASGPSGQGAEIGAVGVEARGGGRGGERGRDIYDVTAMAIMPAHLIADGVAVLLATAITIPLETLVVRSIGQSWAAKHNLNNISLWNLFEGNKWHRYLPLNGWVNMGLVVMGDLITTGLIWGAAMAAFKSWDKFQEWKTWFSKELDKVEKEEERRKAREREGRFDVLQDEEV